LIQFMNFQNDKPMVQNYIHLTKENTESSHGSRPWPLLLRRCELSTPHSSRGPGPCEDSMFLYVHMCNPHPLLIKGPPPRAFVSLFLQYGSWEALDGCKMLLRGEGTICPPGKRHAENFHKSFKIEKCKHLFFMFGFGILLTGGGY
jgi:hypothetical protein